VSFPITPNRNRVEPDRNPLIPCKGCGKKYPLKDYWEKKLEKVNYETLFCIDCRKIKRHRENNRSLDEFMEKKN